MKPLNNYLQGDDYERMEQAVEAEIMRHGFPSFAEGHRQGRWLGIPNEMATAEYGQAAGEIAREIMWWHDGTTLHVPNER